MPENTNSGTSASNDRECMQFEKRECISLMAIGIAHDLNNMLAAILGNIGIIIRSVPADSPILKNAAQVETTARKALDFTNQLQALTGKGQFTITNLDIDMIIREIIKKFQESVHAGITIQYESNNQPGCIKGDNTYIRQIISHLIRNAIEAITANTGLIRISTGTLNSDIIYGDDVRLDEIPQGNNYIYIDINDNGCGMTPEIQGKIFDPFFTTKLRGQGLGLPVTIGIVRAHGGNIEVTSIPGKGSTFRIIFPAVN